VKRRRKKPIGGGSVGDLSEVVDFHALLAGGAELPAGIGRCDCAGFDLPVFRFLDRPGKLLESSSFTTLSNFVTSTG
jgi:alkylated DNA repair protein alkB family protein 1